MVLATTSCPTILPSSSTPKKTNPPIPFSIPQTARAASARWPVVRLNSIVSDSPAQASSWISAVVMGRSRGRERACCRGKAG
jgi:hypothetical protein